MWEIADSLVKPVRFITIFATGILAGLLFDFWFFIAPALTTLPASSFVETTKALDNRYFVPVPLIYQFVLVATVVLGVVMIRQWRTPGWWLIVLSEVLAIAGTIVTLMYNVPINIDVINNWSVQDPPANWAQIRDVWDAANTFRCAMFSLAFACQLISLMLPARSAVTARQTAAIPQVQPAG